MGGKSKSNQSTSNAQHTNNIVNDGDYAGVGGDVTHDESVINFEDDHSTSVENDIDNSVEMDIDNSVRLENDIDNSIENDIDNSVENDGQFAGSTGNINILDGGAIEQSFDFGKLAIEENSKIAQESISAVQANADSVVGALVDSQENAFSSYDSITSDSMAAIENATNSTLDAIENVSGEYATSLTDFATSFTEGISDVQVDNMSNNKEQLQTIAELAKSTSLQGQDIVAEQSGQMVLYVMGGLAFLALIGGAVVLMRGNK